MRILDARLQTSARESREQLGVSLEEKSKREQILKTGTESGSGRNLGIVVDRVSLYHRQSRSIKSAYDHAFRAGSKVIDAQGGVTRFHREEMIQTLVGAVIDKEVVLNRLSLGRDILGPGESQPVPDPSSPGKGGGNTGAGWAGRSRTSTEFALNRTEIQYLDQEMAFHSKGTVTTQDGRTMEFSLDLSLGQTLLTREEQTAVLSTWQERISLVDPLMIRLDGGLPQLSDTYFEFDLDNDGRTETLHAAAQGTGFLAFDRNGDGVINNGSELFGPGTGNGYAELAELDGDGNQWIDENDAAFGQLSVWVRDEGGEDRLMSLKEAGLGAISLEAAQTRFDHVDSDTELAGQVQQSGVFLFEDGRVGLMQQVDLAARQEAPEEAGPMGLEETAQALDVDLPRFRSPEEMVLQAFDIQDIPVVDAGPMERLKAHLKTLRDEFKELMASRYSALSPKKEVRTSGFQLYDATHPDLSRFMLEL